MIDRAELIKIVKGYKKYPQSSLTLTTEDRLLFADFLQLNLPYLSVGKVDADADSMLILLDDNIHSEFK